MSSVIVPVGFYDQINVFISELPLENPDPLLQSAEKEVHKVLILNDRLRACYANVFNSGTDWNKIWMVPIFVDYAPKKLQICICSVLNLPGGK